MKVKNVWANNEGTVTVDSHNTGDLWIYPNNDSVLRQQLHRDAQIADDVARIQSLKSVIAQRPSGSGIPPTPGNLWPASDGCYFAATPCGIGGFRGVPKYTTLDGKTVALYGDMPSGDGVSPAVTKLQQGAWLPDKSRGVIEAEIRDFERWRSVIQNYKGEMCRPN